jgi:hypothetical protein
MMMDAHSFDFMAQSLSSSDKILAIDLLGHGGSEKPVVEVSIEKHTDIIRSVAENSRTWYSWDTLSADSFQSYMRRGTPEKFHE